jgi:hypothetical protein
MCDLTLGIWEIFLPHEMSTHQLNPQSIKNFNTTYLKSTVKLAPEAIQLERNVDRVHPQIQELVYCMPYDFNLTELGLQPNTVVDDPTHLPTPLKSKPLTIILDIDETMVYAHTHELEIAVRPGLAEFLHFAIHHPEIEVLIWTAGILSHALRCLWAIQLDYRQQYSQAPMIHFNGLIYRGAWFNTTGKNITQLRRNHHRCVLVDNSPIHTFESFGSSILIEDFDNPNIQQLELELDDNTPFHRLQLFCREFLQHCKTTMFEPGIPQFLQLAAYFNHGVEFDLDNYHSSLIPSSELNGSHKD